MTSQYSVLSRRQPATCSFHRLPSRHETKCNVAALPVTSQPNVPHVVCQDPGGPFGRRARPQHSQVHHHHGHQGPDPHGRHHDRREAGRGTGLPAENGPLLGRARIPLPWPPAGNQAQRLLVKGTRRCCCPRAESADAGSWDVLAHTFVFFADLRIHVFVSTW